MKFSTKTRYGIRTMIEIGMQKGNKGILQKDISERQCISNKYLDAIMHSLKTAGLIKTLKGKKADIFLPVVHPKYPCSIFILRLNLSSIRLSVYKPDFSAVKSKRVPQDISGCP